MKLLSNFVPKSRSVTVSRYQLHNGMTKTEGEEKKLPPKAAALKHRSRTERSSRSEWGKYFPELLLPPSYFPFPKQIFPVFFQGHNTALLLRFELGSSLRPCSLGRHFPAFLVVPRAQFSGLRREEIYTSVLPWS